MEAEPEAIRNRIPAGLAMGLVVLIVILVLMLLSDIDSFWKLGVVVILAGAIVGPVMFWRGTRGDVVEGGEPLRDVRINSASIPIRGGIGAGILILILLTGVLIDLPPLRWIAIPAILSGALFGGALVLWRRHQGE